MRPTVIALTGLPGTGKSRLAASLFPLLPDDFSYLDIDTLTLPLVRAALEVNRMSLGAASASGALRALRDAQYECLFAQVRELVSFGRSVLVVAPMTHELENPPDFLRVVASLEPARFMLMRAHAWPEVVRRRLELRGDFLDELRLSRWEQDRHRYERPVALPMRGLELETTDRESEPLAEQALLWIATQLADEERLTPHETPRSVTARMRA